MRWRGEQSWALKLPREWQQSHAEDPTPVNGARRQASRTRAGSSAGRTMVRVEVDWVCILVAPTRTSGAETDHGATRSLE
eukprot:938879-Alexandrium_andersonii.AAC.1